MTVKASDRLGLLYGSALLAGGVGLTASADQMNGGGTLVVSRIQYVAPTPAPEPFPQIFNDPSVSGIQGNIFLDYYKPSPGAPLLSTLPLTAAAGYPVPTFTTGLRNLTGRVNGDGTVTIYAITAQTSTISGGEPDPTKLVAVTDVIAATQLPVVDDQDYGQWSNYQGTLEHFVTLQQSRSGDVFRGVAFSPTR